MELQREQRVGVFASDLEPGFVIEPQIVELTTGDVHLLIGVVN